MSYLSIFIYTLTLFFFIGELKNSILACLTKREAEVIDLRFGLSSGCPATLEEIGNKFNVTRERIRQIEARALLKLRKQKTGNVIT